MAFFSALHGILRRHTARRNPVRQGLRRSRRPWRLSLECLEDRLCLSGNLFVNSFSTNTILDYDGTQGSFVQTFASGSAIGAPVGLAVGPSGDVFVAARTTNDVLRYDGNTGAFLGTFVSPGSGGLNAPDSLAFGPDGDLYVTSTGFNGGSGNYPSVLRYDGTTGAFLGVFVAPSSGGLSFPHGLTFGPDGNLYVTDVNNSDVLRYNGTTGAYMNTFVPSGSGGLFRATGLAFGPDGNLYVDSFSSNNVLRYDGKTGAFLGVFASAGGLSGPQGLQFGLDGNLYVASFNTNQILRYNGTTGAFKDIFAFGNTLGGPTYFAFRQTHTSTTVSSSVDPSVFGQSVALTATVKGLGATVGSPTGTVTFTIDGVAQAPVALSLVNGNEQATLSTAALSVGSHAVTATYSSNDVGFAGSTSAALNEVVNPDGTATALSASADPTVFGQPVTFTASIATAAPGAGTPTGTVTFFIDGTAQTPVAVSNGQASFTTATLGVGGHAITASYNGDGNFTSSSSVNFSQTVNRADTTTTLVSSADPSVFGQPVTITATIGATAPGAGMPTGNVTFMVDGTTVASVALNNGQASFTSSTLGVGDYLFTASYSGDGNFNASASTSLNQGVNQANTTTAVSTSVTPSVFGEDVMFTATVSAVAPGAGTPTGTVTFAIDGMAQPDVTLSNGQASFSTATLSVGSHTITASYNGDSNFFVSTSTALSQAVGKADSAIGFSVSDNPAVFGEPVTFTAAVSAASPGAGTPTGTVIFSIDGVAQAPVSMTNGQASFTTSTLSVGDHEISMDYSGDGNFHASSLDPIVTVNKASTTIGVSTSVTPSVFGQAVTFTATVAVVAPGAGAPTGSVLFTVDGVAQAPVALSNDQASFTTSALGVGSHIVTAAYSGDGNFKASTSANLSQAVNKADTTSSVSSSVNQSVFGQPVTFTATVAAAAPGAGTPSGTVTFTIDGVAQAAVNLNNGQATFATSTLSVGSHTVAVAYDGDGNFNTSASSLTQIVDKADTVTTLTSSAVPAVFGESVTFTATVDAVAPGAGSLTGTVTFTVDGTAQTPVALSNGQATFATSALGVGSHVITANYNGDGNFNPTSSTFDQVVNEAATTTALNSSATQSVFGQAVTFTASVAAVAPGAGTPSGTVTFMIDGVAQPSVNLANGQASLTTSALTVGSHTIAVAYNGDGSFGGSTSTLSQSVNSADTTTALSSSAAPSVFGQSVTFTATVSAVAPGAGTLTGTVTFAVDGAAQASVSLSNGQATFTTLALGVGSHVVTASYSGDSNFNGSTATSNQTVNKADTTIAFSASVDQSVYGQPVTFTAAVSAVQPGSGMPTGTVIFFIDGVAQSPVSMASGQASFTTSALSVGDHEISMAYSGDASFNDSTLDPPIIVTKANTTIGVNTSVGQSVFGQAVTFTATVAVVAPGAGTPTGSVIFTVDGVAQAPVALSNDQASFTTSALGVGSHIVTVAYNGDANFNGSTSAALNEVVNKADTATALSASVAPSVFGQTVTFTAAVAPVAPGAGAPTGTMTFVIDGTAQTTIALNNGHAAFSISTLGVGGHSISVAYSGDGNFNASSSSLSQVVNQSNTTMTLSSSAPSSSFGQAVTFTAVVSPVATGAGVPTGTVTFSIDGTAQAPVALSNGQASFTTSTLSVGSHTITAVYSGDGSFNSNTSTLTQVVNKTDTTIAFSVSAEPSVFGQPISFTASVSAVISTNGTITGTVTFSIDGSAQGPVTIQSGRATFTISTLSVGSHEISMLYSGDTNFNSSFLDPVQTVTKAATATTVTAPSAPAVFGQPVTLNAAVGVVAPGSGTPTGTVVFTIDGAAQAPVAVNNGQAAFSTSSLAAGSHTVTAAYNGSGSFNGSTSSTFTVLVNKASTMSSLSSSANPSLAGQLITFTATVSATTQGAGVPTGTVTFTIDGVAQPNVALNNGQASFGTTTLTAGSHTVTVAYKGADNFNTSTSSTLTQAVNSVGGTIVLQSSGLQAVFGQPITFTATVNLAHPTGSVAFIVDGKVWESVALTNGQATFTTSKLSVGNHSVTARYNGGGSLSGTTSATLNETVSKASTTTTLSSSTKKSELGELVRFTAVVAPVAPGAGTPGGKVTFFVDGIAQTPVRLDDGRATFTIWTLGVGTHNVTATYSGNGDFNASSTSAALKETVGKAATRAKVHGSDDASKFGQAVTFVATVKAEDDDRGAPTGTVTFLVDGTVQATVNLVDGKASFTTAKLSVGKHVITAIYNGNSNFAASMSDKFVHTVKSSGK